MGPVCKTRMGCVSAVQLPQGRKERRSKTNNCSRINKKVLTSSYSAIVTYAIQVHFFSLPVIEERKVPFLSPVVCVQLRNLTVSLLPFIAVSSCATVDSPSGSAAGLDGGKGSSGGRCSSPSTTKESSWLSGPDIYFLIYLFILRQYDSETTRNWLADSFFSRFVVTQLFSFLSVGQWTVCVSCCHHLSVSETASL